MACCWLGKDCSSGYVEERGPVGGVTGVNDDIAVRPSGRGSLRGEGLGQSWPYIPIHTYNTPRDPKQSKFVRGNVSQCALTHGGIRTIPRDGGRVIYRE